MTDKIRESVNIHMDDDVDLEMAVDFLDTDCWAVKIRERGGISGLVTIFCQEFVQVLQLVPGYTTKSLAEYLVATKSNQRDWS